MCAIVWLHLVKATELTVRLAESNGSLLLGGWLKVTCGLTACTSGSASGPTLGTVTSIRELYLSVFLVNVWNVHDTTQKTTTHGHYG